MFRIDAVLYYMHTRNKERIEDITVIIDLVIAHNLKIKDCIFYIVFFALICYI